MQLSARAQSIAQYPSAVLAAKKRKLTADGIKVYDFGAGDPIEPTAEFIRKALIEAVPVISQYPAVRGTPELRGAIREYLTRRFKVTLDRDTEILPCTGSKEAIYNVAFICIDAQSPKRYIIGPTPGYFVMERSALMLGAQYYPFLLNEANGYLMDLSTVPEEILQQTAIVWFNYPHNPTGVECDLAFYEKQVKIAESYGILICSDECYVDLYFGKTPPPSILQITTTGVLAFHSCSKRSGMTAYRSGFIAGDKEAIALYGSFRDTLGVATPIYTQAAAAKAWSDDRHSAERREIFKKKRDLFIEFFKRAGLKYIHTDATFYFWICVPGGLNGDQYCERLIEQGVVASPGSSFGQGCAQYIRIATVPSLEDCAKAIEIWQRLISAGKLG